MLRFDHVFHSKDAEDYLKEFMLKAKDHVIRIPQQYKEMITKNPGPLPAGLGVLQPVFPYFYVELEGGCYCSGSKHRWDNFLFIAEQGQDDQQPDLEYSIVGIALGSHKPDQLADLKVLRLGFNRQGERIPIHYFRDWPTWLGDIDGVARNIIDFLAQPSVRIESDPGIQKINRRRRKSKKPPLNAYHIIKWSEASIPTINTEQGCQHRIRYDVRGNWATYTKGTLTGRRIWRRAHQRGLTNELFRPKGYLR